MKVSKPWKKQILEKLLGPLQLIQDTPCRTHRIFFQQQIISVIAGLPPMPEKHPQNPSRLFQFNILFSGPRSHHRKKTPACVPISCTWPTRLISVFRMKWKTVSEAVRYIGFNGVADFVAIFFFPQSSAFAILENQKTSTPIFAHSNDVARAVRCLTKAAGKSPMLQEFYAVAGLLHDIGRLVILLVNNTAIRTFSDDMSHYNQELTRDEINTFGVDHCVVGKQICEKWQFSPELQTAILRHHSPIKEPFCEPAAFIMLGHFLSMSDFPIQQVTSFYPPDINARLGLDEATITRARELYSNTGNP